MSETVSIVIDGVSMAVPAGSTILEACRSTDNDQPTLCYLETLTPVNVCRVCVVEVEGSRTLVPSCSRVAEDGMIVHTDSERVRHSRKVVFEFLASSVDMSLTDDATKGWMDRYGCDPTRFGPQAGPVADRDHRHAGHHHAPTGDTAETVSQPVKVDNELYVRDYSRCVLCYRCVEACGIDAQNTFAIAVAGRGFDARISTEFDTGLTDSACVFCGNCVGVCPTGALMFRSEYELRNAGMWDSDRQSVTRTVCSYCGVGCNLELHTQDNRIVKVTSPADHSVTSGHLCIKGRFGYSYVQELGDLAVTPIDEVLARARR
ncbi:MAG: 2Fe-2S iron-sulfur cluster-binding protein [Acidimicrobiia bacterium]|nr:2Fe-2S iron-sulfur cluster-binding protein [Acidimicrobiia bacterium]MDH4306961.1 2Fe-2S iron-sulfur cluster-binding protein [Acidimicrobiia bacterium]MDH5292828.1 2Fe-2S iron-sulfur cluster-binding protein [Acidimicrobiia bacterium]